MRSDWILTETSEAQSTVKKLYLFWIFKREYFIFWWISTTLSTASRGWKEYARNLFLQEKKRTTQKIVSFVNLHLYSQSTKPKASECVPISTVFVGQEAHRNTQAGYGHPRMCPTTAIFEQIDDVGYKSSTGAGVCSDETHTHLE